MTAMGAKQGNVVRLNRRGQSYDHETAFQDQEDRRQTTGGRGDREAADTSYKHLEQIAGHYEQLALDESQPHAIISVNGELLRTNDAYKQVIDSASAPFLAGTPDAIGKGPIIALMDVIEDVLASDNTLRLEEHLEIGGREHIFLTRYIPLRRPDQSINALVAVYEDITQQVMAMRKANLTEERFRDFARASSDWFFECDRTMRITHLSERFTAAVGQPASLFMGAHLDQIGEFGRNLDGEELGVMAIERRKPFRDQLFTMKGSDAQDKLFHLSAVPIFDRSQGNFNGYRGVGMEVTDRYRQAKEADAVQRNLEGLLKELTLKNMELDRANDRAQAALATKNDFLATMSHELRTPLNAIIGFAGSFEELSFGPLNDRYRDYARDIRLSGEHLLGLINDILDVAVLENGELSLQPTVIDVDQLIRDIGQMIKSSASKRGLTVVMPKETGREILADRRRLTQILVNLLTNAVKFTASGKSIGLTLDPCPASEIRITVWDEGIGIKQEDQDRIFEKFEQIKGHIYNREQDGTGLGLHISRELSRRMGGDLTLTSKPDVGSSFHLTLPAGDTANNEDDTFI